MKIFLFLIAMLIWGGMATAQTALVTDTARVNMRSGKAENYRMIKVLPPSIEVQGDRDRSGLRESQNRRRRDRLGAAQAPDYPQDRDGKCHDQNQTELEAAQKELVTARVELANLQREAGEGNRADPVKAPKPSSFILLVALGAFASGVTIGILILRAYYQKRLHGLRI